MRAGGGGLLDPPGSDEEMSLNEAQALLGSDVRAWVSPQGIEPPHGQAAEPWASETGGECLWHSPGHSPGHSTATLQRKARSMAMPLVCTQYILVRTALYSVVLGMYNVCTMYVQVQNFVLLLSPALQDILPQVDNS